MQTSTNTTLRSTYLGIPLASRHDRDKPPQRNTQQGFRSAVGSSSTAVHTAVVLEAASPLTTREKNKEWGKA